MLNEISQSHGKSQNLEDKLTSWMLFFLSSRWMMFQCFWKQKNLKLILSHVAGTNQKFRINAWLPLVTLLCFGNWFLSLIFRLVMVNINEKEEFAFLALLVKSKKVWLTSYLCDFGRKSLTLKLFVSIKTKEMAR